MYFNFNYNSIELLCWEMAVMELKYLQTFHTIVQEGGFTKAAEKLNYTLSTITWQMNHLEQELNVRLFEKIGRKMVLTKAGQQMIPYVEDVLESLDKLSCFDGGLESFKGELHIGIAETQLCYRIPAILREYNKHVPGARLFLRSMNCYEIRDALIDGSLDLGLFYEETGGIGSNLTTYPIGAFGLSLVMSPNLASGFSSFLTEGQIPVPFVINETNCIFRQIFETWLKENDIRLNQVTELWSIPTIKNLVMNGYGFSFLPTFTVQEELNSGSLVEFPICTRPTEIHAVCAHHSNKWISPAMKLFIELVTEQK